MLFPWANPRVRAAAEQAGPASVRSTEDAEKWSAGLARQGVEARVVSLEDLVDLVHHGRGSGWAPAAEAAQRVAMAHREVADLLHSVLNRLDSAWRGEAADAAGATTRAFGSVLDATEARYAVNSLNITEADHRYRQLKAELGNLGPRPEKSLWDHLTPWDTDTEQAITAYNEKAARYLERYHAYAAQLDGQARALRYDDGDLAADGDRAADRGPAADRGSAAEPARRAATPASVRPHSDFSAATAVPEPAAVPVPAGTAPPGFPPAAAVPSAAAHPVPLPGSPVAGPPGAGATQTTGFVSTTTPGGPGSGTVSGPVAVPPAPGTATHAIPPVPAGTFRGSLPGGEPGSARTSPGAAGPPPGRGARRDGDHVHERKYVLDDGSLFTDDERYARVDPATGRTTVDPTIGA